MTRNPTAALSPAVRERIYLAERIQKEMRRASPMASFIARHADAPPVPIYPHGMTAEACKRRAQRALALLMLSERGRRGFTCESYAHEADRVAAEIRTAIRKART